MFRLLCMGITFYWSSSLQFSFIFHPFICCWYAYWLLLCSSAQEAFLCFTFFSFASIVFFIADCWKREINSSLLSLNLWFWNANHIWQFFVDLFLAGSFMDPFLVRKLFICDFTNKRWLSLVKIKIKRNVQRVTKWFDEKYCTRY